MIITREQLVALNACEGGIEWFDTKKDHSLTALVKAAIADKTFRNSDGENEDTLDYANWGLVRLMTHQQKVHYACFAARQVLKIFEDKYPEDKRPRKAIEAAEKWAADPTEENRRAAADAAYAAAYAAAAAAYAYAAAAADAADAAAYAAYAVTYAVAATAAYAAYAADSHRMKAKILRHGVKILDVP